MDNRPVVGAILRMVGDAAHWRDLPKVFGKWAGVHARFRRRSHVGVWERLFHSLADTPGVEYVLIDSTISKARADASGAKQPVPTMPPWSYRVLATPPRRCRPDGGARWISARRSPSMR